MARTTPAKRLTIREASERYGVGYSTIAAWVAQNRLPADRVSGPSRGIILMIDPADIAPLVAAFRGRKARTSSPARVSPARVARKPPANVCRKGLEADAVTDARSECDAVAGTLGYPRIVWTPFDLKTLAEFRERFETRKQRAAA